MIDFYNAFISYRHAKLDSAIAEHLVRQLEHFHVPHKLKKNLRHQKITRIFRDKDELPITSDLTETITNALEKAEYLIVLCSTNTKESMWVKREIRTFLQTHTTDKVLTVLCDGEPEEVIPEELLSTEKEYLDAQGFLHRVKVPIEPLSCDYRLPRARADREELPRLASALLGCSYDELLRRRRQYMIRRVGIIVATAFVALAAFGGYLMYSNKKINESYMESLRSRSVYLANEATQLLNEDKRVDSIQLALASLPSDEKDKKPVTAQAVRAITETTGAYKTSSNLTYSPAWNYRTSQRITICKLSDDEKYLAAMDIVGNVYCWDTMTHKLLLNKPVEIVPVDVLFIGNENILITYKDSVEAYNIASGENIWSYDAPDALFNKDDVIYNSNAVFVDDGKGSILKLSAIDGSIRDTYQIKPNSIINGLYDPAVSPDGKKIAYCDSSLVYSEESKIHIYDTETGTDYSYFVDTYLIYKLRFADNDHLCVMSCDKDAYNIALSGQTYTYIRTGYVKYHFFDGKMQPLWNTDLEYRDIERTVDIFYIPSRNAVMCYAGNAAAIFDLETGNEINRYQTGSSIIAAGDWNNNDQPELLCSHGDYVLALDEDMANFDILSSDISLGIISETLYFIPKDSPDIIAYNTHFQDDEWEAVDSYGGFISGTNYQNWYADDEYLVIAATVSGTQDVRISVIDPMSGELMSTADIPDVSMLSMNYSIKRIGEEFYCFFGNNIYIIDPENGKVKADDYVLTGTDTVSNGTVIGCNADSSEVTVEVMDLVKSKTRSVSMSNKDNISTFDIGAPVYNEALDMVFVPVSNRLFYGDLSKSSLKELKVPDSWIIDLKHDLYVTTSDDGSLILLSDGNNVIVTDDSLKVQYTLKCDCYYRLGATFKGDVLYIASDNYLELYNSRTGELIRKYIMTLYDGGFSTFDFDDEAGQLFVQTGEHLSIFDMASWTEIASIENIYFYHKPSDRFYTYSFRTSSECTPGYFRHYSLSELIDKANRYLDGQEPDEAIRTRYGL